MFTVLGFSDKDYNKSKTKPADLECSLHFDPTRDSKYVYGLYYDANSPERQEIIDCATREAKFVRNINDVVLLGAAKNSPFNNAEVAQHFMKILKDEVVCSSPFVQKLLKNCITRGFNNMVEIMHSKYI